MLHAFYFKPDAEKMIGQVERINQKTIPRDCCFRLENKKSLSEMNSYKDIKKLKYYGYTIVNVLLFVKMCFCEMGWI